MVQGRGYSVTFLTSEKGFEGGDCRRFLQNREGYPVAYVLGVGLDLR